MTEKIIAFDWNENPIYDSDGEYYINTPNGYVMDAPDEITEYVHLVYGPAMPIHEWLKGE
ncbi:hypothetical protein [Facklamia hominis]|uniref:hypothetical protein n=1 Tax=Facklamia hominis TaxID=178214 RepID=UPI0038FCDC25